MLENFEDELGQIHSRPKLPQYIGWMDEWKNLYPVGSVVRTLADVIDPLKNETLPARSFVTIKECKVSRANAKMGPTWILCADSKNQEWNIRPTSLEKYAPPAGKKGRFRILAAEAEVEKMFQKNKESTNV